MIKRRPKNSETYTISSLKPFAGRWKKSSSLRMAPTRNKTRSFILKPSKGIKRHVDTKNRSERQISGNNTKAKTKADIYREFLIPEHMIKGGGLRKWFRYSDPLRGIYWYYLSKDVRKSEWEKWNGLCLTCLKPIPKWEDGQCGHVVSSAECGEYLRFDRRNLTIQHGACNNPRFKPNAVALNAIHYDERYGQGAWQKLYDMRKVAAKHPSRSEYRRLIVALPSYQEVSIKAFQESLQ